MVSTYIVILRRLFKQIALVLSLWLGLLLSLVSVIAAQNQQQVYSELKKQAKKLLQKNQLQAGIPYLQKMVSLQPYNETALFWLAQAIVYQEEGQDSQIYQAQLKEAIHLLKRCVEIHHNIDSTSSALALRLFHLGIAYWYANHLDLARNSFSRSYHIDDKNKKRRIAALYNQAALERNMGNFLTSNQLYNKYLKLVEAKPGKR